MADEALQNEDDDVETEAMARQKRQNVRVNARIPIIIDIEGMETVRSRTRDISATGIGFATRLPLEIEQAGTVTIEFPDWTCSYPFIVRFLKPILAGQQVGVQIDFEDNDERERMVKQIFAIQREQLRAKEHQE